MQQGMSCPISNSTASVSLPTFSVIITLSTKCSLVNLALFCTAEWHAIVFKLPTILTFAQSYGIILTLKFKLHISQPLILVKLDLDTIVTRKNIFTEQKYTVINITDLGKFPC